AATDEDGGRGATAAALAQRETGLISQDLEHVRHLPLLDLLARDHADGRTGLADRRLGLGRGHHHRIHRSRCRWGRRRCCRGCRRRRCRRRRRLLLSRHGDRTPEYQHQCQSSDDPRHLVLALERVWRSVDSLRRPAISAWTRSPGFRIVLLPALPGRARPVVLAGFVPRYTYAPPPPFPPLPSPPRPLH